MSASPAWQQLDKRKKEIMFDLRAARTGAVHVCGHRGHSIGAPENTMAAFRKTKELGGTACEIDVVLSKDGEIVVLHDASVDRTTDGSGLAKNLTTAEITALDAGNWFDPAFTGERVPVLGDVLTYAKQAEMGLQVEIKEPWDDDRLIGRLAEVLSETGAMDWMVAISFDHQQLLKVKDQIPGIRTEGITHARHANPGGLVTEARLDSVSVQLGRCQPADAAAIHKVGAGIRYTLPAPAKIEKLESLGWNVREEASEMLQAGLIDVVSGDDVGYIRGFVDANPVRHGPPA